MFHLKVGDAAPEFAVANENGQIVRLSELLGKKVVLYFYPKDDTPGCTAEACSLRDGFGKFTSQGYEILGVSPDSAKKHTKFREKFSLPFSLLADEDHAVSEASIAAQRSASSAPGICRTRCSSAATTTGLITATAACARCRRARATQTSSGVARPTG